MRPETAPSAPPEPETIEVHEHRIWCDGDGGALGHPRVFMEMGAAGFVECGYCDRRFVLAGHVHAEDEHTAPAAYEGSAGR
jgi:uncharacterized Zn-finger protein